MHVRSYTRTGLNSQLSPNPCVYDEAYLHSDALRHDGPESATSNESRDGIPVGP